jgi:hypothetical protein
MSQATIGNASNVVSHANFSAHAKGMGNRFRGFATIEAATTIADGKIKGGKGSGYSGRITKTTKTQVVLNPRLEGYADAVNKQRARECDNVETLEHFEAKPRSWGVHVEGTSFVEHKGNLYLEVRVLRSLETNYCIDGQPVAKETAEALLHPHKGSGRQGVAKAIILRDYKVENLTRVRWTCPDGIAYDLTIE